MRGAALVDGPPRDVLVVVTRRIGDVLLATPLIRSLRAAWPDTAVDALVFAGTEGVVAGNPDVRRIITVPERPRFSEHLELAWNLTRRYDLAISLLPGDRPTLYAWFAGRKRVGLHEPARKTRWKQWLLNAWIPFDNQDTHTVRMHLAVLASLGVSPRADVLASWTQADAATAQTLLAPLEGAAYAVIHPYPKFRYKMWTAEGWIAVAEWLSKRGLEVVLTGGPGADERSYANGIAQRLPAALNLAGSLTLGATAFVVSRAAVYIGPDTAITHAAAGLGIPTVALYGPTNPVKWGPWPSGHAADDIAWARVGSQALRLLRLVEGAGACVPCGLEGCERHIESTSDCLTGLAPERVIAAVEDVLRCV
jgi:heptosyltransferase-3